MKLNLALIKVQGVVLKSMDLNDNDKIITLYTDKLGKVKAVAHGAKKQSSKLMASTQPFCFGEFLLYKGKSLYTLKESSINESFQELLLDFDKIIYGSYFIELIDGISEDENKNVSLLALLLKTLYILKDTDTNLDLLKLTFNFKAISLSGYMPNVKTCVRCKKDLDCGYFSIIQGGMICSKCFTPERDIYGINKETLTFLRILKNIKLEDLRDINYNKKTLLYVETIMDNYLNYYIGAEFKSQMLIKKLKKSKEMV